ncbi:MAG: hypothetical protein SFY80_12775 [Verrucomicrobiota bacterium]|nr:hypothetical protein [Verrucomicrobiota bacterium]
MKYSARIGFFVVFLAISQLGLQGQPVVASEPLAIKLTVAKATKDVSGKVSWLPGEQAKPGDTIRYTATYSNQSDRSLRAIKAQVPIPEGAVCLSPSADPVPTEASFDGKTFLPWTQVQEQILQAEKTSEPLEIRIVRWLVPEIKARQTVELSVSALLTTQQP